MLVAAGLGLYASSASAHISGGPSTLAGFGGLGVGVVAGLMCGYRDLSHGIGLGGSLLFLYIAMVTVAAFQGEFLAGAFLSIFLIPLVGVLPLAIAYFPMYALARIIKRYVSPTGASDAKAPTHEHYQHAPHGRARRAGAC